MGRMLLLWLTISLIGSAAAEQPDISVMSFNLRYGTARDGDNAWEHRHEIEPSYEGLPRPKVIEILKLLPKTNCRECGEPTCTVFAARAAEGAKGCEDCPALEAVPKKELSDYLSAFRFD